MKVLVTGYTGQLGYDVMKEGIARGYEITGAGSKELNITDKEAVMRFVQDMQPDCIVHCAAYTAVDQAEDDRDTCYDVNVNGTKYLAEAAKAVDAKLFYISTDYVFDGQGEKPFTEEDKVNPIGYYGQTKLQGEQYVQLLLDKYFIVRISWVFGSNGNNFVKTMLRLAETRDELNVVADQIGSPTYTVDLSKLVVDMMTSEEYGVYHASNEGFCSWAEFAAEIFKQANRQVKVNPIPTSAYPTKAKRPFNSRMSKNKLEDNGFARLPAWQDAVARYLKELNHEVN